MTKKSKYDMPAVQNFAFGGIANPSQRAFLRGSDQSYLDARQKELDAFEAQRLAYNDQLTKWQTEVYNPYKSQVDAYNAASEKYNTDVYNPYKSQVDAYNAAAEKYNTDVYNPYKTEFQKYEEAVNAWNAGDRTSDYAGPAEPKLASEFTMAAPTQPTAFGMTAPTTPEQFKGVAPVLPFKEEEVVARQQVAATNARKDAGNRAVAIDVVSNPDQFNFGSMSVSNRFMAKGGEVMQDDPHDRTASAIIKDFEGYGYTRDEIMALADQVAQAGRGGDELLAYLSPESVEFLKAHGGAGTINPMTGLPEFKGGVIGSIVNAVKKVFGGGGSSEAAPAAPSAPAAQQVQREYEFVSEGDGGYNKPTGRYFIPQYTVDGENTILSGKTYVDAKHVTEETQQDGENTFTNYFYRAPAPTAPTSPATPTAPTSSTAAQDLLQLTLPGKSTTSSTPSGDPMSSGFVGPRTASEQAAYDLAQLNAANSTTLPKTTTATAPTLQQTAVAPTQTTPALPTPTRVTQPTATRSEERKPTLVTEPKVVPKPIDETLWTSKTRPVPVTPKTQIATPGLIGGVVGSKTVTGGPVNSIPIQTPNISFTPLEAAKPLDKINLGGRITSPVVTRPGAGGGSNVPRTTPQGPDVSGTFEGSLPYVSNTPSYSDRGVGSVGPIGSGGNIPIFGPSVPSGPMFGNPNARIGGAATSPSSYFAMTPQSSTGLAPGSAAIGPADMPLYGAKNTMNAIGSNPNLSPTMLGGQQNAGVMRDRLGNQIYAPGAGLFGPPGYAKGGGVDLEALMAQNAETLSDEKPDEVINTDPVGTAQKMLADLNGLGKASPTRQSIKRTKSAPGGGASADKGMQMSYEDLAKGDLGAMKDVTPGARNTDSAKAQMEELARVYQMKIRAAQNKGRGLMADTMGAPTLEGPTLTKGSLTKKRFKDGGEAKKAGAESVEEPSIFGVTDYATKASARMYPDQMGQDDERDAARHMLAAATMSKKYGPGVAEFMGKAHERMSNPESFFSMFGIGKPRDDYEMDVHNNRIGAQLAARATSQAELEKLVAAMARESRTKQTEGKPWTMSREQMANRKGQVMTPPPEYRADGSPEEGEIGPAFVTPKSGKGRKEGEISRQLKSGDAYVNMAKGVTELPYDIAGAPVDLATMLLRPFGYSTEKPVMGSDFIKEKMTQAGVRPEPPADPTAKGFYTAGELLSNLTNPAGVTRSAVKGAKKTGEAATAVAKDFQQYNRQLDVPGASYAVRPTGSTMLSGPVGMQEDVSKVDQLLKNGLTNAKSAAGQNQGQEMILKDFWDKKARNYFTRQFGTPDDPIANAISKKQIKGAALDEMFPEYLIDQINVGKTRVNDQGQERFFPKYPRAMEDFTSRYDKATGIKGSLITLDPAAANPRFGSLLSDEGKLQALVAEQREQDKLLAQGVRPELINTGVGAVTKSALDPNKIIGDGADSAGALLKAYEEAGTFKKMDEPQKTSWINQIFGEGRRILGKNESEVGKNLLPENVKTAIDKGEPVYDVDFMRAPLTELFDARSINQYLASIPPREAANIRFEDAVKGALKMKERASELDNVVSRIKAGKPVADSVFSRGVSAPLLQFEEGPYKGFAWKRIEKREATVPEGAYVGHSVGGYERGGATYTQDKREGFNTGKWQVYTLRDNRNRPVNTIEVKMLDENTPVVTQIKGNGRATGNTAPEKYDGAVLDFLQKYLKPSSIEESDSHLTPLLQNYKKGLGPDALDNLNFI